MSTDPYFNLASEEYLLENSSGDVFMLWQNGKSVIIGKNQNAWAEVNTEYVRQHGVTATVRRTLGSDIDASCGQLRRKYEGGKEDGICRSGH